MQLQDFYNRYHQKNAVYSKIISRGNFTYFYILELFDEILPELTHHAKKIGQPIRVLDVGCGVGAVSLYLAKLGCRVVGIDVSSDAVTIAQGARKSAGLKNCVFAEGELGVGSGSFDLVICSEIIEHIADQDEFLRRVASQLRPGGTLFLGTPSTETVLYKMGLLKQFDAEVGHLRRYSEAELQDVIEKHGVAVEQIRSVESPLRNVLFITRAGWVIRFIRGPLIPVFHWIDRLLGVVLGHSDIQVIGKKR
ncbi:MAG: methyltransferase domain-containing protein [Patescibacteria group bacterium]